MSGLDPRVEQITEAWFVREPLLLMTLLSHEIKVNSSVNTMRCGRGIIEINAEHAALLSRRQLENCLKAEVIRILLRHPYRTPQRYDRAAAYTASSITLNEYYEFDMLDPPPNAAERGADFWRGDEYQRQSFEFYYRELLKLKPPANPSGGGNADETAGDSGLGGPGTNSDGEETKAQAAGNGTDASGSDSDGKKVNASGGGGNVINNDAIKAENAGLWEEDDFFDQKITEIIRFTRDNMLSWGTIPGKLQEMLTASLSPVLDYRKILRSFRASILTSDKILTRLKPSRRYGFLYQGKRNQLSTKLLIGVDVSGSISDDDLDLFYSVINRFFKYGVPVLDALQFDASLQGKPLSMRKARKTITVTGRGGTDFQPIIDFFTTKAVKSGYDGLIIFTDGDAHPPDVPPAFARKILWLCNSRENFDWNLDWMSKRGRAGWIE